MLSVMSSVMHLALPEGIWPTRHPHVLSWPFIGEHHSSSEEFHSWHLTNDIPACTHTHTHTQCVSVCSLQEVSKSMITYTMYNNFSPPQNTFHFPVTSTYIHTYMYTSYIVPLTHTHSLYVTLATDLLCTSLAASISSVAIVMPSAPSWSAAGENTSVM